MNSLRSLYRISFFQQIVIFVVIYSGLDSFLRGSNQLGRAIVIFISIILIGVPTCFIINNFSFIYEAEVPNEYFEIRKYLARDDDSKIYFPFYLPLGQSFIGNFTWAKKPSINFFWYGNPFTSLFSLSNVVRADHYPDVSSELLELRSLADYQRNSPAEIIETLRHHGVKYLIFDNNFFWQKNFPAFDLHKIPKDLKLEMQFGNIYLYNLEDKKAECKKSFGRFQFGYCHVSENEIPDYLIDVGKEDYLLERYSFRKDIQKMELLMSKSIYRNVVNPSLADYIIGKNINQSDLWTIDNSSGRNLGYISTINLFPGKYKLVIPIIKTNIDDNFFKKTYLEVFQKNLLVTTIKPYGPKIGINYEIVDLEIEDKNEPVRLSIDSEGFLVMRTPFVIKGEEWEKIFEESEFNPKILYSDIYPELIKTKLKINGKEVELENKFVDPEDESVGILRVNLLDDKYVLKEESKKFSREVSAKGVVYGTSEGSYELSYLIENEEKATFQLSIGTYFLKKDRNLKVEFWDEGSKKLLFGSEVFEQDEHPRIILPPKDLEMNNRFILKLKIDDSDKSTKFGMNLYKFELETKIAQ